MANWLRLFLVLATKCFRPLLTNQSFIWYPLLQTALALDYEEVSAAWR
ncbi:hypothetical protein [Pseudomonas sp. NPDC089734]